MNLKDFINKYKGIKNVGNTPDNKGQCVGLVMVYISEVLKLSHIWGHAKDIYNNAPTKEWTKIPNKPDVYPNEGDVIVMDKTWGGGFGHIAIVVESNSQDDSYTVFEQNNPLGAAPKLTTHGNWDGVIGWLRSKNVDLSDPCKKIKESYESRIKILETNLEIQLDEKLKLDRETKQTILDLGEKLKNSKMDLAIATSNFKAMEELREKKIAGLQEDLNISRDEIKALLKSMHAQDATIRRLSKYQALDTFITKIIQKFKRKSGGDSGVTDN